MEENSLPLGDRILELRKSLLISLAITGGAAAVSFFILPWIIMQLQSLAGEYLYTQSVQEGFILHLETAVFMGLILTLPFHVIQIINVIFPSMDSGTKLNIITVLIGGYVFFLLGIFVSLTGLVPLSFILLELPIFAAGDINPLFTYKGYINWALHMLFYGGLLFLVPMAVLLLLKGKLIMFDWFKKRFGRFIIGVLIAGMILTPPDIISLMLFAIPVIGLTALVLPFAKLFMWGVEWTPE